MGRACGEQPRAQTRHLLITCLLLLFACCVSSVSGGCTVGPYESPKDVNTKILKCSSVSVARINQDYFNDRSVSYKEIILENIDSDPDDFLNVINEHQTETLKLTDSRITDEQLKKIFHNKNFARLRWLDVSGNQIQRLVRDTFQKSIRLRSVNLSRNQIHEMQRDVFADLHDLNELHLNHNNLTQGVDVLLGLRQLIVLDLSNNAISNIERHMFLSLESLVNINLSNNKLYILPYQVFENLVSIEVVDLSHNLLVSFPDNFMFHNRKLKILHLHHNLIGKLNKNSFYGLKELHTLDLSFNQLLTVDRNAFDTLDSLKALNLEHNQIQLLSANVFLSLKQLETLDLSSNEFQTLPLGIFANQFKLEELKMDHTRIKVLSNWISRLNTNATINKFVLSSLKVVSMKNSSFLRDIESCFFKNLENLEKLTITGSEVTFLPLGIDEMAQLTDVDLSDNRLQFIPQGIKHLSQLKSINLLGNDLACDCHMFWMLNWIDELESKNKSLPSELLRLSELKCRNGYPGDIIRVLHHINCVKPHLVFATQEQTYPLFTDAILECSFAGTPGPEIVWRTPYGEILRLDESKVNHEAKYQLDQQHQSVLQDTLASLKYQQHLESSNNGNLNERVRQGPGITLLENGFLKVHNISRLDGGLYSCFAINIMGNATTDVSMEPSPFVRSSFWTVSLGLTSLWISNLGVSQTCIQRFLAVPDISFARKSVFIFVIGLIFIKGASCLVGLIMYAKYEACDPVATKQIEKVDQILPFFVMDVAGRIPGLPGVFIAGIFSAALSSMSSGLNTLAGTIYEDFFRHRYPDATEKRVSDVMKCLVVILGLVILSLVFVVERMGQVFRISIAVSGITAGALLGLFTIGMLSRYVNTKGVIWGAVGSMVIVGVIMVGAQTLPKHPPLPSRYDGCEASLNYTIPVEPKINVDDNPLIFKLSFMYYTLLGSLILCGIAYIVSFFTGGCEPFDERLLAPFRRSENWQKNSKLKLGQETLYKETIALEEVRKASVGERRMSIDVA